MAKKYKQNTIGAQIKQHLRSQEWLATQIGMPYGTLSKKINGYKYYNWKQEDLDKINKVLGTSFKL